MLKCLLATLACALLLQNVCASELGGNHMGKKSNRVNLLSRAVGARMLAGTNTPDQLTPQTNSFGAMGVATNGQVALTGMTPTAGSSQFVPIARTGVPQLQQTTQTTQTTFDASHLTPDQLQQLQRLMTLNTQQAQQAQQQQQAQQVPQQQMNVAVPQQQQQQQQQTVTPNTQQTMSTQQQMPTHTATTTTGVEQQLLEQQKMTQKLQEQLKAMQQLQSQQQNTQQASLAQQLQQFESVQRGNQQPQLNQMPANSLAKSNEQPQRVTFQQMQQGNARTMLPTQSTLTLNTVQQTLPTFNQMQQTLPTTMNPVQQNINNQMPSGSSLMQQQVPNTMNHVTSGSLMQQQVPSTSQFQQAPTTSQFQQVQQVQQKQVVTTPATSTVRDDICANAQPGDLFAHPSDPTQFVICYGFGEFTVMDCPDMLVYNDHLKRCDVNTEVPLLCKSNPCLNNGKCSEINSASFKCECPSGFGGQFCEKLDTCSTRPCGTDGVCIPFVLGSPVAHVCLCNGGRTVGVNCQKVEQNPCLTPGSNLRLLSVSFNPSVFAHCEGSRPHFKFCQPPLVFSNAKQTCEWA